MKKFLAVLLMLAMLLCGAAFAEDTAPALTKDVVVLFTSDVHCGIDQGKRYHRADERGRLRHRHPRQS